MATRAIFEIDLQGQEKFKAFIEQFNKYKADLKSAPASWAEMEKISREVKNQFASIADYARAQKEAGDSRNKNEKEISSVARATAIIWTGITRETGAVFSNVAKITGHLAKWSTLSAALGGLLGAGSLWGIDKLANTIASNRRMSMGLGINYGTMISARTNLSPLIDSGSLLQNISTAKFNQSSQQFQSLRAMGLSENLIKYGKTEDVIAQVMDRAPQLLGKDKSIWGARSKMYPSVMPDANWFALGNAEPAEREQRKRDMIANSKRMDPGNVVTKAWQDLATRFSRSSAIIEKTIMERLSPLAEPLGRLSEAVTNFAVALIDSPIVKDWIDALSSGLENLASYVQTPAFQSTVESFIKWVGQAAGAIWDFIASFSDETAPAWAGSVNQLGQPTYGGSGGGGHVSSVSNLSRGGGSYNPAFASNAPAGSLTDLINKAAETHHIDPRVMEGIRAGESAHGNRYDVKDDLVESSWGPFQLNRRAGLGVQFEQETAAARAAAGLGDLRDPRTIPMQVEWVANYLEHGGSLSPWMGYHGMRNPDPSWGNSGLIYVNQNTGNNTPRAATLAGGYSQAASP